MLIAELELPWLFNSIRCEVHKGGSGYLHDTLFSHFCLNCHQVFMAKFGWRRAGTNDVWNGEYYWCPACGEQAAEGWESDRRYRSTVGRVGQTGVPVPRSMTLKLYEFKKHLRLTVDAPCISFDTQHPDTVRYHKIKEHLTFDMETQKTWFRQSGGPDNIETTDVSNPYDRILLEHSVLRFLKRNSRAWRERKSQVAAFLRKLRETICKKIFEVKGYRMKAISVPGDKITGLMVNPIRNMAWRMAVTDGPNLKELFYYSGKASSNTFLSSLISWDDFDGIMAASRAGKSYPQAVLQAVGLPDTKSGRRMIAKRPVYAIAAAKMTAATGLDEHGRKQLCESLLNRWQKWTDREEVAGWLPRRMFPDAKGFEFFRKAVREIGQRRALPLVTQLPSDELNDAAAMFEELTPAEQLTVWKNSGSAKKIHDTCTELHWRHKHPDYDLEVPEHIVNRLLMQKESLRFYLPKTYHELHAAGEELRNCVGGRYPAEMRDGQCCIVLVADDLGKLKVCIELRGDRILQAKLFKNRPVYEDMAMYEKVMEWAKAKKLTPATRDLVLPEKQQLPQAM